MTDSGNLGDEHPNEEKKTGAMKSTTASELLQARLAKAMVDEKRQSRPKNVGPYRLEDAIWKGSLGSVFRGFDTQGKEFNVEVVGQQIAADSQTLQNAQEDFEALREIQDDAALKLVDVGADNGRVYIVTEPFEGDTLRQRLMARGRISEKNAVAVLTTISDVVRAVCHRRRIHGRLSLDSVVVDSRGNAKLADLSMLVRLPRFRGSHYSSQSLTFNQSMAPEVLEGATSYSEAVDVYSLGVMLYVLVTGKYPYRASSTAQLIEQKKANRFTPAETYRPKLSPNIQNLINSSLDADPRKRPADVGLFFDLLTNTKVETFGDYQLLEQCGEGASGEVYRAKDKEGRPVAMKILATKSSSTERKIVRFYQEAKLAMSLSHPNLIQVYEVGEVNGRHFIAMQYLKRGNLARYIKKKGLFSESDALDFVTKIAQGLKFIHDNGIVHRDLNPSNILIDDNDDPVITDLGLSKLQESDMGLTMTTEGVGTPQYIAPEQFQDAKNVDHRADIYGLGATLYVMLTGKLPFTGASNLEKLIAKSKNIYIQPEDLRPSLNKNTVRLIRKCMSANPEQRPDSAGDFIELAADCLVAIETGDSGNIPEEDNRDPDYLAAHARETGSSGDIWQIVMTKEDDSIETIERTTAQVIYLISEGKVSGDTRISPGGRSAFRPMKESETFATFFDGNAESEEPGKFKPKDAGDHAYESLMKQAETSGGTRSQTVRTGFWSSLPLVGKITIVFSAFVLLCMFLAAATTAVFMLLSFLG